MRISIIAAMLLAFQTAEAATKKQDYRFRHKKSPWAVERTGQIWTHLERTYGKNLMMMRDERTGQIDPTRFGWDNRVTGGKRLGSSISYQVMPGLVVDATQTSSFFLGASEGFMYTGIQQESTSGLPNASVQMTNCFATTYAYWTSVDNLFANYNREQFKWFDSFVLDPTFVVSDFAVNFEMCEFSKIYDQIKNMFSLDYAAIADALTRELMVIALESPEARQQIVAIKDAALCAKEVAEDFSEEFDSGDGEFEEAETGEGEDQFNNEPAGQGEDQFQETNGQDGFESFAADIDSFQADISEEEIEAARQAAEAAAECFGEVDRYTMGQISGRLFAQFFNNELKPIV